MNNRTQQMPRKSKKNINRLVNEHKRHAFNVPSNTIKDGADKLPTVQAPA
ncbi:hypothetical protein ACNVED_01135 [Legionella sp. D16C41]